MELAVSQSQSLPWQTLYAYFVSDWEPAFG